MSEITSIDLRTPTESAPNISVETNELPKQSQVWAEIAKPFSIFVLMMLVLIIIFPFLSILIWPSKTNIHSTILDWAKFITTPIVALCASITTYYFGSGNTTRNIK